MNEAVDGHKRLIKDFSREKVASFQILFDIPEQSEYLISISCADLVNKQFNNARLQNKNKLIQHSRGGQISMELQSQKFETIIWPIKSVSVGLV